MTTEPSGRSLLKLIRGGDLFVMPGVFDGFSLAVVEHAGYEAAFVSGASLAESRYRWPDVGLMGLGETVEGVRALCRRTSLMLFVDADTGYGNAVNVHFAVRALADAGAAGVMIEDQTWPKRCGHMQGKEVISASEMVGKVRAAVDARGSDGPAIMARTDAAASLGLDEAIERANRYADAGADVVFADALLSASDVEQFARQTSAPVVVNIGLGIRARSTTPLLSLTRLADMGVDAVIVPRMLTAAAVHGMTAALVAFGERSDDREPASRSDLLASFEELQALVGLAGVQELERRYLTDEQLAAKYD